MKHKVGIIGLGVMGQRMLTCMARHAAFEVVLIWDLDPSVCRQVKERYPDLQIAADAETLVAHEEITLVYIATPPATHIDYARLALQSGKAIFCEKPLAVDVTAAQTLVAEVTAAGLPNAVNFVFAADPAILTLAKHIHAGAHGQAKMVEMRFHFSEWPRTWQRRAAGWLAKRADGGFVREVFSHFAFLTQLLIGPMTIRSAQVTYPDDRTAAESYIMADLASNGIPIRVMGGVGGAAPDYNEWTLYGSQKSYRLYDWRLLQVANESGWDELKPEVAPLGYLAEQLNGLDQMLRGEPHGLPDFAAALTVQEVVEDLLGDW